MKIKYQIGLGLNLKILQLEDGPYYLDANKGIGGGWRTREGKMNGGVEYKPAGLNLLLMRFTRTIVS